MMGVDHADAPIPKNVVARKKQVAHPQRELTGRVSRGTPDFQGLVADLQKVATGDPTVIPAEQAVAMATILGARAASLEKEIGSLETGKRADMITLRLDRPHAVPLYHVYSQIVYALKGSDVQDTVVDGKPIVRDGRSLTLDPAPILAKAKEYAAKVTASLQKQ